MKASEVQIILIPYDSGNRNARMGNGPEHFIRNGLGKALQDDGHHVFIDTVQTDAGFTSEIQTQFQLYKLLAARVAEAHRDERFPLILSGNCGASVGAVAGMGVRHPGLIWFDAHGDFNTPETSLSGFLDGMGLAVAAGRCWQKLALSIPNFRPLAGKCILHLGGRDFDTPELTMFGQSGVTVVDATAIQHAKVQDALHPAISGLRDSTEATHVHIDLDVLDPVEAPANGFATEAGGLSVAQISEAIDVIKDNLEIASATISAFDPDYDPQGRTLRVGVRLMRQILGGRG